VVPLGAQPRGQQLPDVAPPSPLLQGTPGLGVRAAASLRGKPRGGGLGGPARSPRQCGAPGLSPVLRVRVGSSEGERSSRSTVPPETTEAGASPGPGGRGGASTRALMSPTATNPFCLVTCRAGRGGCGGRAIHAGRGGPAWGGMRLEQRLPAMNAEGGGPPGERGKAGTVSGP